MLKKYITFLLADYFIKSTHTNILLTMTSSIITINLVL